MTCEWLATRAPNHLQTLYGYVKDHADVGMVFANELTSSDRNITEKLLFPRTNPNVLPDKAYA